MNKLQKAGGIAALVMATGYLVGFAMYIFVLDPGKPLDSVEWIAFLASTQTAQFVTILFIYVIVGFALVVLVQALYERLKPASPALMQTAAVLGFIWAGIVIAGGMIYIVGMDTVIGLYNEDPERAATVWLAVGIVFEGLGGGIESIGGVWTLLISWAALMSREFPKALNYLGLVVGGAGTLTIVPALAELTNVFGLGQIVWFIWVGAIMVFGGTKR